ncbi:tRNA (adenosine(37)-N6)-threonylcarbamoyltransferase complex transferase subunit TsaD [Candidatus Curtissbacteria bacterium]|nr:tRNA (adenosine(37)-N6)-threonylcarbamoyltransferase complex transferase subunit TsaD [Candidatus Curtissbacteria bacterium]
MKILGIETSCDETSAAVVENGVKVLSLTTLSSLKKQIKWGGIVPEVAAREQVEAIIPVIELSLSQANLKIEDIDGIAVTHGPGLLGSLLVGVESAKTIAMVNNLPIMGVDHMKGHTYASFLETDRPPFFPFMALLVSGGHTQIVSCRKHDDIKIIGETRDDSIGEAFDKVARLIGLPYPGGPEISKLAKTVTKTNLKLSRPMLNSGDFDFSFSGIKTEVARIVEEGNFSKAEIAYEFEEAVTDVVVKKLKKASEVYKISNIVTGGGVAANEKLREKIKSAFSSVYETEPKYCTDNGAMIAAYAYFNWKPVNYLDIKADPSLNLEYENV